MVPPLTFHKNWEIVDKEATKKLTDRVGKHLQTTVPAKEESTQRAAEAEHRVALTFKRLADDSGWKMAVIVCPKYENYLNKIKKEMGCPPRPADLGISFERGEHDLLLIHPGCGAIIVSVKSVGGNFEDLNLSEESQMDTLLDVLKNKVVSQLEKEVRTVQHVLSDLSPPVAVHVALALPNIPRTLLTSALQLDPTFTQLDTVLGGTSAQLCLCLEEFPANTVPHALADWFKMFTSSTMSQDQYEIIVGRYCGLASTVEIPSRKSESRKRARKKGEGHKGGIEVRSMSEAVREVSTRFRSIVLLPFQVDLLLNPNGRLYMWGSMGSGKSVMLTLKARMWLGDGHDVIIVNISYDVKGSPIGHALLQAINEERTPEDCNRKMAKMVNLRLAEYNRDDFISDLQSVVQQNGQTAAPEDGQTSGKGERLGDDQKRPHFILDEVYAEFQKVFDAIADTFIDSEIWAAGLEAVNSPANFKVVEMKEVLRCPPSIQRVLQATEYYDGRCNYYTTSGAKAGLPAEGPPPHFVLHESHSSSSSPYVNPLQCEKCAQEDIRIFSEVLGIRGQEGGSDLQLESTCPKEETEMKTSLNDASAGGDSYCDASAMETPLKGASLEPRSVLDCDAPIKSASPHDAHKIAINPQDKPSAPGTSAKSYDPPLTATGPDDASKTKTTPQDIKKGVVMENKQTVELPPALTFRDIAILCKDSGSVYRKEDTVYKLDKDEFNKFMEEIGKSVYVKTLRDAGYPVRIVRSSSSGDLASSVDDAITASWINPASGLEWPVVIYMPGNEPTTGPSEGIVDPGDTTEVGLKAVSSRMTTQDRDYMFWTASRSTAFLIVHVP